MIPDQMAKSMAYEQPKSVCTCGHLGDGKQSEHAGLFGHGSCSHPGCACTKFTWARHTDAFTKHMGFKKEHG